MQIGNTPNLLVESPLPLISTEPSGQRSTLRIFDDSQLIFGFWGLDRMAQARGDATKPPGRHDWERSTAVATLQIVEVDAQQTCWDMNESAMRTCPHRHTRNGQWRFLFNASAAQGAACHSVSLRDAFTGVMRRAADLDMGISPSAPAPSSAIGSMVTAVGESQ